MMPKLPHLKTKSYIDLNVILILRIKLIGKVKRNGKRRKNARGGHLKQKERPERRS